MEKLSDVLLRFQNKFAAAEAARTEGTQEEDSSREKRRAASRLLADRHPNRDFFVADILDWALKDDRHSMEHPMFSLSKKRDHRVRHYEHNANSVTIKPGADGLA